MVDVSTLGSHIDAYADLVGNAAHERDRIAEAFTSDLRRREIPDITMEKSIISVGSRHREFYFVRHRSGALMTIALRAYGQDLLIKWDLWFKGPLNMAVLVLAGVIGVVGLFAASGGFPGSIVGIGLILAAIAVVIGAATRGMLFKKLDFLSAEDLIALKLATNASLQASIDQIGIEHKLRELMSPALSAGATRII